ncbi:MAG: nucleotidyltransferase domain-containing protein [Defluviitaleaceae bacterium]|nr:nucleotidyltransferase domain-containing protein [Defluviitaleaceae bacterium]MCL2262858.1 nucleotidyltransferase domain-containing protein [Defluviitaleaceae bacterium]
MAKINPELLVVTDELSRNTQNILGDKLRRIILYGSRARGDYKEYSDLDIMVLADYDEQERSAYENALSDTASDLGLEHDIIVSVMLNNEQLFMRRSHISPFYRNVLSEGVEIYGEHKNLSRVSV